MSRPAAIVTGAAGGIGRATALMLAERGYAVVVADSDEAGARATAAAAGPPTTAVPVDVASYDVGDRLVDAAQERWGRLDALLTAAGIAASRPLAETNDDAFARVLEVNLLGTLRCCRAAVPALRKTGGAVVTFGSIIGRAAMTGQGAYGAAKAAIESLTRTLALEHAREGVRFNCLVPGSTDTAMMWAGVADEDLAAARATAAEEVPMGRVAHPGEIAEVACFLVSPAASFMTGASVVADGGTLAKIASTY